MTTTIFRDRLPHRHFSLSSAAANSMRAAIATMALWRERARQRRQLAEMSPQMLADIGVSVSAARAEASRPFWSG
jgi:uncharacterized protein YjiS (DUF1127 family)